MAIKLFVMLVFPCVFERFSISLLTPKRFVSVSRLCFQRTYFSNSDNISVFLSLSLLKDVVFSQPVSPSIMCLSLHRKTLCLPVSEYSVDNLYLQLSSLQEASPHSSPDPKRLKYLQRQKSFHVIKIIQSLRRSVIQRLPQALDSINNISSRVVIRIRVNPH